MVMATSRRHAALAGALLAMLVASAAVAAALAAGGASRPGVQTPQALLAGLRPAPAPRSWPAATIASGDATIHRPPGWRAIPGDKGTVSFALRDRAGRYLGYLNVTPRQGDERLATWAGFRLARNRDEGDRSVVALASRRGVPFARASGSCVIDDYASRVGANPYRELACLVRGRRSSSVLIATALRADWPRVAPSLLSAAASFAER
jgi:hypothetical protein